MTRSLIIAPVVARLLGGPAAAAALLDGIGGRFWCATCGQLGDADAHHPAAVVVLVDPAGDSPDALRLAHPGCADPPVRLADHPATVPLDTIQAVAWQRGAGGDPPSVLAVAPATHPERLTPSGDRINLMLAELLAVGFVLLTDPHTPLPELPDLAAHAAGGRVIVHGPRRAVLWDGALRTHPAWAQGIRRHGRLGFVAVADTDLTAGHPVAAIHAAIADGRAVGASARLIC